MKRKVKIESTSNRSLIIDPPYPSEFKPGVVLILDKLLGRIPPTEDLVYLLLTVLSDEQINQFCGKVREESFTSNKLLCVENYYLEEMAADITQGLQHKHHHHRLNKLLVEAFETAYINKEVELPFFDQLMQLKEFCSLTDLEVEILHIFLHVYTIRPLQNIFLNSTLSQYELYALIIGDGITADNICEAGFLPNSGLIGKGLLQEVDTSYLGEDEYKGLITLSNFSYQFFMEGKQLLSSEMIEQLAEGQSGNNFPENASDDFSNTR